MTARNVEQEFDTLKSDISKLSSDLVNLRDAIRSLAGQDAQEPLARMRAVLEQANEGVEATASALGARSRQGIASVEQQMRERPLASILIGLGVGLIIGKLVSR